MTPEALSAASFASYAPAAQQFDPAHLRRLRRRPLAVCPACRQQAKVFDTLFPVERESHRLQFQRLETLAAHSFAAMTAT